MKQLGKILSFMTALLAAASPLWAGAPLDEKVKAVIASEKALEGATVAVCATGSGGGETLVSVNGNMSMVPASNMKLISTGLALEGLGGGYRFKTRIGYSGTINGGVLDGDIYIIGGADPMLGSWDNFASPVKSVFGEWMKMISEAGIKRINGYVIGDGRFIEGAREEQTWLWEDIGTYYGTGMSGLGFAENVLRLRVEAGATPGDALSITQKYPFSPWLSITYDCTTGPKGTGDRLYLFTTDLSTDAVLRGTFAAEKAAKDVLCSNKFPELTCSSEFASFLDGYGLESKGAGYAAGLSARTWSRGEGFRNFVPADSLTVLGSTVSPELRRIARKTNYESNNFCAETLFRVLGKEKAGSGDYESSRSASAKALGKLGLDAEARRTTNIVDGSGLSRKNVLTASFLCRYLDAMRGSKAFGDFYDSIPVLESSKIIPADKASRVRRKTGSMEGVYCISGYYTDENGESMTFSILINSSRVGTYATRQAAERILSAIIL